MVAGRLWDVRRWTLGRAPLSGFGHPGLSRDQPPRESPALERARDLLRFPRVDWPDVAVESLPPGTFWPPFCPWPSCDQHRIADGSRPRFHRHGAYHRPSDGEPVVRFRCLVCRRTCSQQTFSFSYYLKRADLSPAIAANLEAGSAHRQIARSVRCAASTVTHRAARLGRHAMLLLARAVNALSGLDEPIVADHFETFAFSQDFPFGVATAVGADSWFIYALDPAPHRPGGPPRRRSRAAAPPSRGGYRASFTRVLDAMVSMAGSRGRLDLITDDHHAYAAAVARHPCKARIRHRSFANPKRRVKGATRSAQARRRDAAMFPVDLLHAILRHTCAHHRRETIAFGRRLNALMERMFLTAVWRNFVKNRSERRPGPPTTPAMLRGLAKAPWSWAKVFSQRLFATRTSLPAVWKELYERSWITPAAGSNRLHTLVRAY